MGPNDYPPQDPKRLRDFPFAVQWRTLLVRAPRLTPLKTLFVLHPPPYPIKISLPSRNDHHSITVYAFLPPKVEHDVRVGVHLDFHGGSFISGSPEEQAPFCSKLARERHVIVLEVDYGKGPYRSFPSALQDAEDVLSAVCDTTSSTAAGKILRRHIEHQHPKTRESTSGNSQPDHHKPSLTIDITRLSLSGFSSGGNIALNLALSISTPQCDWPSRIPEAAEPIPVLLFYPSFDVRSLPADRERTKATPAPGRFARAIDRVMWPTYFPTEVREHPRASPGLADVTKISSRARIWVVLPEKDTLAMQSQRWVRRMRDAGMGKVLTVYEVKGMGHAFCNFPDRWLGPAAYKQKKLCYERMMEFWDGVLAEGATGAAEGGISMEKSVDVSMSPRVKSGGFENGAPPPQG